MVVWSRCVSLKTGAGCDVPQSLSRRIILIARPPRSTGPPLLDAHNILRWSTRLEVLGWVLDNDKLTIPCRPARALIFGRFLADWPHSRHSVTCKQMVELTDFLLHMSLAVSPGKFFVKIQLAHACPCRRSPNFCHRTSGPGGCFLLALSSTVTPRILALDR